MEITPKHIDYWIFPTPSENYDLVKLANFFFQIKLTKSWDDIDFVRNLMLDNRIRLVKHQEAQIKQD